MASIGRRTRLAAALRLAVPAAAFAAFAWILLRFAVAASVAPASLARPAALILLGGVLGAALLRAALVSVPVSAAVRELDRRAGARGRVIAAHELAGSDNPFARAAVADASAAVLDACARVASLFPLAVPAQASRVAILVLLAPLTAVALDGVTFRLLPEGASRPAEEDVEMARRTRAPLPTLAWVMRETSALLAPLSLPRPTPTPVAIATPVPVPTRGATITDPEKRAYFDKVLEGATPETVGKDIVERFTKELVAQQYEVLVAEFKTRSVSSGAQYDPGGETGVASINESLPPEMLGGGGGGGGIGPAFDVSKAKSEYLKDPEDIGAELLSAQKESFDAYLKEFAAELLEGMEEALEKALSDPSVGHEKDVASAHLKGLPNAPGGLSEGHEPHGGPSDGPVYATKEAADGTPAAEGAFGKQALGGTAAGGTGAGAGNEGQAATAGGPADGKATGERLDLGGTLDERLAVVEVVRRMSGGTSEIDDTAAAEVVRKSTKAAEAEAAAADEVPEEYRGAVRAYFEALTPDE